MSGMETRKIAHAATPRNQSMVGAALGASTTATPAAVPASSPPGAEQERSRPCPSCRSCSSAACGCTCCCRLAAAAGSSRARCMRCGEGCRWCSRSAAFFSPLLPTLLWPLLPLLPPQPPPRPPTTASCSCLRSSADVGRYGRGWYRMEAGADAAGAGPSPLPGQCGSSRRVGDAASIRCRSRSSAAARCAAGGVHAALEGPAAAGCGAGPWLCSCDSLS